MTNKKFNIKDAINELEEINAWFQGADVDLDEGLTKLKRGAELIKSIQGKITEIENEVKNVKESMQQEMEDIDYETAINEETTNPIETDEDIDIDDLFN